MNDKTRPDNYRYGGRSAEAKPAAGVKGVLFRTHDGTKMFRVYHDDERFTDYEIRHDDLSVTIAEVALAAFYKVGERNVLDRGPQVLGSKRIKD